MDCSNANLQHVPAPLMTQAILLNALTPVECSKNHKKLWVERRQPGNLPRCKQSTNSESLLCSLTKDMGVVELWSYWNCHSYEIVILTLFLFFVLQQPKALFGWRATLFEFHTQISNWRTFWRMMRRCHTSCTKTLRCPVTHSSRSWRPTSTWRR